MKVIPFVPKNDNTEYKLYVEYCDDGSLDIVDVEKVSGEKVNIKKFKKKLGKSDWKMIEQDFAHAF